MSGHTIDLRYKLGFMNLQKWCSKRDIPIEVLGPAHVRIDKVLDFHLKSWRFHRLDLNQRGEMFGLTPVAAIKRVLEEDPCTCELKYPYIAKGSTSLIFCATCHRHIQVKIEAQIHRGVLAVS